MQRGRENRAMKKKKTTLKESKKSKSTSYVSLKSEEVVGAEVCYDYCILY